MQATSIAELMSVLAGIIILGLILVTALYVAAEFAVVSVRPSRVQSRAEKGSALAQRLLPVLLEPQELDRYIAVSQVGITISSLVLGAYGQAVLTEPATPLVARLTGMTIERAHSTASVAVLVGLTVLAMILGELVPKSIALDSPTKVALWTYVPMRWSLRLTSWWIVALNGSGALILRALGVSSQAHRHIHSPEEIAYLVAESGREGLLKPNESLRLGHALHLGRRAIQEMMVPRTRIEAVDAKADFTDALHLVTASTYTRLPVYDGTVDDVVGIVHARDVALAAWSGTPPRTIAALMRPPLVLPATMMADRALEQMKDEGYTMAILVDEFGGTAGLVTMDDILDELLGDVADEFHADDPAPERLADGRVRLPGALPVTDALRWTRARWMGALTVGGAVLAAFGRAPRRGERITIAGVEVEVERVHRSRIDSVIATPADASPSDSGPSA